MVVRRWIFETCWKDNCNLLTTCFHIKLLRLVMGKNFFQKVRSTMFIPDSCLAPNTCICFETGLLTGTLGLTNEGLMTPTNQKFLNWLWESCRSICFTVSFKNIEENSVISTPWCKLWRKFTMCLVWHSKHHWHCERATLLKAKWKKKRSYQTYYMEGMIKINFLAPKCLVFQTTFEVSGYW